MDYEDCKRDCFEHRTNHENDMKKEVMRAAGDVPDIRSPPALAAAGAAGLTSPAPADSDPSTQHEGKKVSD